ncbi:hypothetical protein SprV_0602179800 [Sparganum proliferum]
MDIATDLCDIIDCPPTEAPYAALKEAFISRIPLMLAETADRILEYYQPPVTVNVANRSAIASTVEDVNKRVDALTLEISQLRTTPVEAFSRARKALADTTVLVPPIPDALLSVLADASNFAICVALQQ